MRELSFWNARFPTLHAAAILTNGVAMGGVLGKLNYLPLAVIMPKV